MRNLSEDILKKYLMGECSEKELTEISTWIKESDEHACQLFRMEEIYQLGKVNSYANELRMDLAEKRLYKRIKQESNKQLKILRMYQRMKYAAIITVVLLLGGGAGYWFYQNETDMLVATATKVWLNNSATLKYPRKFSDTERNVYLEGEAYFKVTRNPQQPFIVESDAMRVRVLGTVFNFKCDKNSQIAEATLIEGEIEVKGKQNEGQIILAPGQRAELNKGSGRLIVKQVEAKLDAVWHDDLIPFEQANIFTITKALERFYDVKIILSPDIRSDKTYSGVLKKK